MRLVVVDGGGDALVVVYAQLRGVPLPDHLATSVLAPVARSTGASYDSQSVRSDGERWFPVSPASLLE